MTKPILLGMMGNRGTFPSKFVESGIKELEAAVQKTLGDKVDFVNLGSIESYEDAKKAAIWAQEYRRTPAGGGCIGIICSMYNFSSETGIRDFLRLADLDVPLLLQTEPDDRGKGAFGQSGRRDGACGRFSVANALRHIGYRFTLTSKHVEAISSDLFAQDLAAFFASCVVVDRFRPRGRGARVGIIGSGPDDFQTVTTVSTELLGHLGMNSVGMDLITLDRAMRDVDAADAAEKAQEVAAYMPSDGMPEEALLSIARMALVFDRFIEEHDLDGVAVRCWTEMQQHKIGGLCGISPCACMSMLSDKLIPAACEVDLAGWMGMQMLQDISGLIPSLGDWNNMFADTDDEVDLFHCGVWAKQVLKPGAEMTSHKIIGPLPGFGAENAWGTVEGELAPGTCAFLRPCTDARKGRIFMYAGTGEVLDQSCETFGTVGRVRIPRLQELFRTLCDYDVAVEHHCPVIVGSPQIINMTMKAIRDAVPYFNHGRDNLVDYYEHLGE